MLEPASIEKIARLRAALPYLTEGEAATRWAALSEGEKVAFTAILRAATPALGQIGGALAKVPGAGAAKKALGLGMGAMTAVGAGQAFAQGASKSASLVKRALGAGLHDALDLGAYGLLAAGPFAELAAPQWAEHHHGALAAADLAGLGVLARHHIPGLKPAAH